MNRASNRVSMRSPFGSGFALPKRQAGFTLIEVMITVVIVAVLVAFAYPVYTQHVVKTRRTAAAGCALEQSQFMERFQTTNRTYVGGTPPACSAEVNRFYTVGLAAPATSRAFTVQAVPTSVQNDPKCGTLTISHTGAKTVSGTWPAAECW